MSIIFKWNEDCVVIGQYKLLFRVHSHVFSLLANSVETLWEDIKGQSYG